MDPMVSREEPSNRAHRALLITGILGIATGIVFAIVGQAEIGRTYGEADGVVQFIWGGIFAAIGIASTLLWLTVSALTWKAK
jgi:hypothetical protein